MGFAAVLAIVVGLSFTVTKVVDLIRNVADKGDTFPKWVWNVVAFVVGVLLCLGWEKNFAADLMKLVPAFADDLDNLQGFTGYLLSGLVLGGFAGFGHELMDNLSSGAKAKAATANTAPTPVTEM
jgi:hypothetical protein